MAIKRKRFFKKKIKKHKFNKFFSYKNQDRRGRTFLYKDFERSDSYNTNFTKTVFQYVNFSKASMKFCGFNGTVIEGCEFKNAILTGSRFKGASFNDVLFMDTKLDRVNFEGATFQNTIFIGTSIKRAKGIRNSTPGIIIYPSLPHVDLSPELEVAIRACLTNTYVKKSNVLDINKHWHSINIQKLLGKYLEKVLIDGLSYAQRAISKDFHTLSYLDLYIKKSQVA